MHKDDMTRLALYVPSTVLIDLALEAVERIRNSAKATKPAIAIEQEMDHLESWLEQLQAREDRRPSETAVTPPEYAQ